MSAPAALLLTFTRAPPPAGAPIAAGLELAGRGYARVPTGTLYADPADPALWRNTLPIHWPQAPVDWGPAPYLTLLASDGTVLANTPTTETYFVRAGDQPRIAASELMVGGVGAGTDRPYGTGRYGDSLYGIYPAAGAVFFVAALADYAWLREDNACRPWTATPAIVAGGCA